MAVVVLEYPAPGVALLKINRPEAKNALNTEVRQGLAEHFTALGRRPRGALHRADRGRVRLRRGGRPAGTG